VYLFCRVRSYSVFYKEFVFRLHTITNNGKLFLTDDFGYPRGVCLKTARNSMQFLLLLLRSMVKLQQIEDSWSVAVDVPAVLTSYQKRGGYDHEFVIAPTIAYDHCSQ